MLVGHLDSRPNRVPPHNNPRGTLFPLASNLGSVIETEQLLVGKVQIELQTLTKPELSA